MQLSSALFSLRPQNLFLKNFLCFFQKKKPFWKNFLYFLKRKLLLYFRNWTLYFPVQLSKCLHKTTTLKKILIFRKIEPKEILILPSYTFSKESFFYILGNGNLEKKVYISGDGTFLYFQEKELSYISGKVYSEP